MRLHTLLPSPPPSSSQCPLGDMPFRQPSRLMSSSTLTKCCSPFLCAVSCRILILDTRLETQGHKEGSRETPRLSIPPEHLSFARCPFMEAFSPTLVHIPTVPGEVGYEVTTPVLPGEPFHSLLPLPKMRKEMSLKIRTLYLTPSRVVIFPVPAMLL